jgi:hypothetical protein
MPPGPLPTTEPHKELRFTRGAQGALFLVIAAVTAGLAILLACLSWLPDAPLVPRWSMVPPFVLAVLFLRIGLRCLRHAYLIFTPLGIEIFPFFRPADNLRVIHWTEIAGAEVNPATRKLILHYDEDRTSGVVASLRPIPEKQRRLLKATVEGVMANRRGSATPPDAGR